MVVFTCNNCGESLQKPKVAKHYRFQCRNSISLTCVDCMKDFLNDEYIAHTKCITEAERYGGKDFVLKSSARKGEKKQQEWINIVNDVLNSSETLSKEERNFLQSISKYDNIPRKKVKFLNFIKNALGYKVNYHIIESCWEKMESAYKENNKIQKCSQNDNNVMNGNNGSDNLSDTKDNSDQNLNGDSTKNQSNKHEKIGIIKNKNTNDEVMEKSDKIKKKKRTIDNKNSDDEVYNKSVSKKRKLNKTEVDKMDQFEEPHSGNEENRDKEQIEDSENLCKKDKKFDWKRKILEIFETQQEIPLKKLKKKMIKKYLSECSERPKEEIESKLNKHLYKISALDVIDDIVKLK